MQDWEINQKSKTTESEKNVTKADGLNRGENPQRLSRGSLLHAGGSGY